MIERNRFPLDEDGNLIDHVPGLEYYRDFLSEREQAELLALIDDNPWQEGVIARRQQFYGEIYYHTSFKSKILQGNSNVCGNEGGSNEIIDDSNSNSSRVSNISYKNNCKRNHKETSKSNKYLNIDGNRTTNNHNRDGNGIPIDESGMRKWLDKTIPFFVQEGLMETPTQVLINEYKNNMGIASHFEDFDAFGPVILTVSLVSPVYMTLKKPTVLSTEGDNNNINACDSYDDVVKILLEPGSLLVMKHDARYKYRHGIGKYKWVNIPTLSASRETTEASKMKTRIKRDDSYRRVSLTVRHLLSTRRRVHENEDESDTIKDPSVY